MNSHTTHVPALYARELIIVLFSFGTGFLAGSVGGLGLTALVSGLISAAVSYAAYGAHLQAAAARYVLFGAFFALLAILAVMTTNIPLLASLAMAIVAFSSSVIAASVPLGLVAGLMSTSLYLLTAAFSLVFMRDQGVNIPHMLFAVLLGLLSSALVLFVISIGLSLFPTRGRERRLIVVSLHSISTVIVSVTKEFRRAARDGTRRAIALGVAMYVFQSIPAYDGVVLIVTVAIVLPVYGRISLWTVGSRLLWSLMAIAIALILPSVFPQALILVVAGLVLCYSLATTLRSATNSLAAACIAFLLFIGAPGADIGIYAGWRLLDVAAGFVIGWLCGYVLWPKQPLMVTPIPGDLHIECARVQPTLRERTHP